MSTEQPIIIIKKKGGHGGHHGGAWKVAYADFVTAMMALFIVLWLLSSTSKKTQEGVAGYFRDPNGTAAQHGTLNHEAQEVVPVRKDDLTKLKASLLESIHSVDSLKKLEGQIEITLTNEGLRIELIEDKKGTFFETGSAQPTPVLVEVLKLLSKQLGSLPNRISVEGHTDAIPYSAVAAYGNWELSADRANMARRLMQASGVGPNQISQVRGFADQRLRKAKQPFDPSNRRVSLIVQYLDEGARKGVPEKLDGGVAEQGGKPAEKTAEKATGKAAAPAAAKTGE